MATKTPVKTGTYPMKVTVCGKTYDYCGLAGFRLKPVKSGVRGKGFQHTYIIPDRKTFLALEDLLANGACDTADKLGDDSTVVLAIYNDLGKLYA